jgi:hypothetical protein
LVLIPNLRRLEIVVSHPKNPYCTVVSGATGFSGINCAPKNLRRKDWS